MQQKNVFEEITTDNFPYLAKDINLKIQEAQQTPKLKEIYTQMHYNQTAKN